MITPGLWRRSLTRGAQWRLLALNVAVLLLPALLAMLPIATFLGALFDESPRAKELVASLDSAAVSEVLRQVGELPSGEAAIGTGLVGAVIVALLLSPLLAGLALAAARADETLDFRGLLRGGGEHYLRLLRMTLVSVLPLGVAGGVFAGATHLAHKANQSAVLASEASRNGRLAFGVGLFFLCVAHVTLEAGRAHLAAQTDRRSAFLAWWAGLRLLLRHPLRVLGLFAVAAALGFGLALVFTALRLHLPTASGAAVLLAFLLGQLAVAAVAWNRTSLLMGLTELVRADLAGRAQRKRAREAFEMAPPKTSPPAPGSLAPLAQAAIGSPMESGLLAEPEAGPGATPFAAEPPAAAIAPEPAAANAEAPGASSAPAAPAAAVEPAGRGGSSGGVV